MCVTVTTFPYADHIVEFLSNWLSYDIVRFKIELGVEEKFMYKLQIRNTTRASCRSVTAEKLRRHFTMT